MPSKKPVRGRPAVAGDRRGVRKGSRLQISHTITPDLLSKVDRLAEVMGQSRAAVINLAVYKLLEKEGTS